MAHRIETVNVKGSPTEVFVFEPKGAGPHPGMIVCQHIPNGHTGIENDRFTLSVGERYAEAGYVVAAPFIFHCPVMGFFGSLDKGPSPEDVDAYDAALTKAGVEHVFHRYEGANHAFQDKFGDRYHPEAAEDAWRKALAFFAGKLKPGRQAAAA